MSAKDRVQSILDTCQRAPPSTYCVLEDIEEMFPRQTAGRNPHLFQLVSLLEQTRAGHSVLATCSFPDRLDPAVRHGFQSTVRVSVTLEQRRELLERLVPQIDEVCVEQLLLVCAGWTLAELTLLATQLMLAARRNGTLLGLRRCTDGRLASSGLEMTLAQSVLATVSRQLGKRVSTAQVSLTRDVGGMHEAKNTVLSMVRAIQQDRHAYRRLGIQPPLGVLLYGPPGTGKTLLARAVATECHGSFLNVSIPQLIHSDVGDSEKSIADVFARAQRISPTVLFLDEVDALFSSRDATSDLSRKMVTQLLHELDRLATAVTAGDHGVVLIAATNHPSVIDEALLAPGRLDQLVYVGLPTQQDRCEILDAVLKSIPASPDVYCHIDDYAARMHGFTGADIQATARAAALGALRRRGTQLPALVEQQDIVQAITEMHARCGSVDLHELDRFRQRHGQPVGSVQ